MEIKTNPFMTIMEIKTHPIMTISVKVMPLDYEPRDKKIIGMSCDNPWNSIEGTDFRNVQLACIKEVIELSARHFNKRIFNMDISLHNMDFESHMDSKKKIFYVTEEFLERNENLQQIFEDYQIVIESTKNIVKRTLPDQQTLEQEVIKIRETKPPLYTFYHSIIKGLNKIFFPPETLKKEELEAIDELNLTGLKNLIKKIEPESFDQSDISSLPAIVSLALNASIAWYKCALKTTPSAFEEENHQERELTLDKIKDLKNVCWICKGITVYSNSSSEESTLDESFTEELSPNSEQAINGALNSLN